TGEYDFAGGILGEPVMVIKGKYTGLPLPANAEIVIEGECLPDELANEGPFGEWHGYYANRGLEPVPEPVIRVKTIYHRDRPILTCSSPGLPPNTNSLLFSVARATSVWVALDKAGVPGIKGVWAPEELGSLLFTVVSIEQKYPGHPFDAGRVASDASRGSARYIVIVDDDIDPSDLKQVMWAVATRSDPDKSITVLKDCPSTSADPVIPLSAKKEGRPLCASRAIINACRPYHQRPEWYPMVKSTYLTERKVRRKWRALLEELLRPR
ncbi:MAG: UbiD family decarboxylase, partial [Dehalococcoidia bacterium]|nr:UbiD family decarboxylase [Dehalococcoidia bacterium]